MYETTHGTPCIPQGPDPANKNGWLVKFPIIGEHNDDPETIWSIDRKSIRDELGETNLADYLLDGETHANLIERDLLPADSTRAKSYDMPSPLDKANMRDMHAEQANSVTSCLWSPLWFDGMLLPDCPFALEETRPADTNLEYACLSSVYTANTMPNRSTVSVAMPVHNLIGTRLADEVQNCLPRFHFEVPNHPLKLLIYKAEDSEIESLQGMDAWKLEPISRSSLPADTEVIGTMMVYKAKADELGMLAKIKARLV
jgi:hypothetical protein